MDGPENEKYGILVSHSGKQYVHQLLLALQRANFPFKFLTSFAYKPKVFPFTLLRIIPENIARKIEKEFRKRSFATINEARIAYFSFFEIIREISDKLFKNRFAEIMLFYRDRIHDQWASKQVKRNYSVVIGYEECSLKTFRAARKNGLTTILDLAQIHYKEIDTISKKFPVFSEIYKNEKLRKRINIIKEEELHLADYIICLSEFAKLSLMKYGYPENRIYIVNLGFDPDKFSQKITYPTSPKLKLVYAGTITKRKGIDLLLKLINDIPDFIELTFIGPMADAGDLFETQTEKFIWYPYLEQEEMNLVMKSNDVFVFPSYLDSWAMVVIEAMACGLPVIVSDNTGAKDAVDPSNGFVTSAGDYEELREKVMYFYKHRLMVEQMGKAARIKAEAFTWKAYHDQIDRLLKEVGNKKVVRLN